MNRLRKAAIFVLIPVLMIACFFGWRILRGMFSDGLDISYGSLEYYLFVRSNTIRELPSILDCQLVGFNSRAAEGYSSGGCGVSVLCNYSKEAGLYRIEKELVSRGFVRVPTTWARETVDYQRDGRRLHVTALERNENLIEVSAFHEHSPIDEP